MSNWTVEFYRDSRGKEPVADFIDSLTTGSQAKVLRFIDLLAKYGVLLKEPYTKQLKGKLRELRIADRAGDVRVIYFTYTGRRFVLLHGFLKKTAKTPKEHIELAEKRMNDYIERQGGNKP